MGVKRKKLVRPREGRVIAGVCIGLANHFDIDVTLVRILWVLALFPGGIPGILPYLLCWLIIPSE
ncbi:MAG: Phage shock protein C [Microgenomates bacterium OLB22]|nr:MAG: Phage shock protein C [Microgenomates bacterium OLB22]